MRMWNVLSESPPLLGAGCHPAALDDCSTRLPGVGRGRKGAGSKQTSSGIPHSPPCPPDGKAPRVVDQGTQRPLQTVATELFCRDQFGVVARKPQSFVESDRHPCRLETLRSLEASKEYGQTGVATIIGVWRHLHAHSPHPALISLGVQSLPVPRLKGGPAVAAEGLRGRGRGTISTADTRLLCECSGSLWLPPQIGASHRRRPS